MKFCSAEQAVFKKRRLFDLTCICFDFLRLPEYIFSIMGMSKKAILCVDDEAIIVLSLKNALQRKFGERCAVVSAYNAKTAFEVIDEMDHDGVSLALVICDYMMPGMKGDELLIRIIETHPCTEAIMVTGKADGTILEKLKHQANMIAVFDKPWVDQELFAVIEDCLEKRALQ